MYLEHFQLHHQPFSEHAAVAALWQDTRMDEGLARLEYLVEHGTLGLITGASGRIGAAVMRRFFAETPFHRHSRQAQYLLSRS